MILGQNIRNNQKIQNNQVSETAPLNSIFGIQHLFSYIPSYEQPETETRLSSSQSSLSPKSANKKMRVDPTGPYHPKIRVSVRLGRPSSSRGLHLEALESFLVGPGLDGEIGLGVEADAEDHDGEEAGDVAGELPVLPLARLPRRRWSPVEEVTLGPLLVARAAPPALSSSSGATSGA